VAAVHNGRADAVIASGVNDGRPTIGRARALVLADPSHVYTAPAPNTNFLFVDVRERPFDDVRVRRALSYAIDRRQVVKLAGGSGLASLSCQMIPPELPGYAPTCPFTRDPTPAGSWSAPDPARAQRLVAASGSRGARVTVWGFPQYAAVTRYAGEVLRRLGYRVQVRVVPDVERYFAHVNDARHHTQVGLYGWIADSLSPADFFEPFLCSDLARNRRDTVNVSRFCDRRVDAAYRAAVAADGSDANARWAALDRRVLAASPAIPLFTRRSLMLLSDRVGNAQIHQQLGPLLDQFWVR
jgi:peptide/nickel transport system substrate-binding protein